MRAVVHERYGAPDVLRLAEVDEPVPAEGEVVVRVHATTVNRTDCGFRQGSPFMVRFFSGLRRPKQPVLGTEFAGVVSAVGGGSTGFAVGDEVFGVNVDRFGAHAEYVRVDASAPIAPKPPGLTFQEAAALCDGGILGLMLLDWTGVHEGQRVLVYGASGAIGTACVQLATRLGAHVTAVCNTRNVDVVRSLGPDEVVDYETEPFATGGEDYDVVIDAVGKLSIGRFRRSLVRRGTYASTDFGRLGQNPLLALVTTVTARLGTRRVMMPIPRYTKEKVQFLADLVEAGEYRAVIDRTYPLEQVVEATEYVETEQKTGNVVLVVVPPTEPPG